jgi:hypothetical protein
VSDQPDRAVRRTASLRRVLAVPHMNQAQARLAVGLLLLDAGHRAVLLLSGTVPLERRSAVVK